LQVVPTSANLRGKGLPSKKNDPSVVSAAQIDAPRKLDGGYFPGGALLAPLTLSADDCGPRRQL